MADLFVGNIDGGVADEEIKEFLVKYGFPPFDSIKHFGERWTETGSRADVRGHRSGVAASPAAAGARYVLEQSEDHRSGHDRPL